MGEARVLLQDGGGDMSRLSMLGTAAASEVEEAAPKLALLPIIVIAVLCCGLGVGIGWKFLAPTPQLPLLHVMVAPPENVDFELGGAAPGPPMLSPDGTMITFTGTDEEGTTRLYLRHLDQGEPVLLSGTDGAAYPFWSPDSKSIGFFTARSDDKLKKVSVTGSAPITLCPAANGKGGSWNSDGTIIFAPSHDTPIFRVAAIGGDPEPITTIRGDEGSHRHPRFLPDGRRFLFVARLNSSTDMHSIRMGSLDSDSVQVVTESLCQAEYSGGKLLTARDGVLLATPFDPKTGSLTGGATPLVEDLLVISSGAAAGSYSVSNQGMLSFQTGEAQANRILQWAELDNEGATSTATDGQLWHPRISPDGSMCVVEVYGESSEGADLWLVDLATGLRTRFTFEVGDEIAPCWTPDGKNIVYVSRTPDRNQVLIRPVGGVGGATALYEAPYVLRSECVTPDGASVVLSARPEDDWDILRLPLSPGSEPEDLIVTDQSEGGGRISPDGRWIAYHRSSSASNWDVFVSPFGGGSRKWQVSTGGAVWPQWTADGTELLVNGYDGRILAFQVDTAGESFAVGNSRVAGDSEDPSDTGAAYTVHPDGKRILRTVPDPSVRSEVSLIHIVTDWQRALAR